MRSTTSKLNQISWNCVSSHLLSQQHRARFWIPIPNRLGLCDWHCICNYHMWFYFRWPFQSSYHSLLCFLARLSMEEGPILHFCSNLRVVHGRIGSRRTVPPTTHSLSSRICCERKESQQPWWTWQHSLLIPVTNANKLWILVFDRVLCRQLHCRYFRQSKG